jgi:hypothetical protein
MTVWSMAEETADLVGDGVVGMNMRRVLPG